MAFCEAVLNCEGKKSKVIQWTCSQENHKTQGKYYHMVIKLNKIKRLLSVWEYLKNEWNVYVHFSYRPTNYYLAWLYTTKEDEDFIQSAGHPDLGNSGPPRNMAASQVRAKRWQPTADFYDSASDTTSGRESEGSKERNEDGRFWMTGRNVSNTSVKRKRSRHLSCYEVSNIYLKSKSRTELNYLHLRAPKRLRGRLI